MPLTSLVNDAPVANPDTATVVEDTLTTINVLGNDTDAEMDTLTVTAATALHGTVTTNPDGTLSYTPNTNYTGADTISYSITDGNGGTSSSVVNVTVTPVNDAPVLSFTNTLTNIAENSAMAGMVVTDANATDAEGEMLTYSLNNMDGYYSIDPATGIVTLTQAGADWVNAGNDLPAVSVTVTDGTTPVTGTAAMPLTSLVNDAPVAMNDAISIVEDTIFTSTVSLLANDSDEESAITVIAGTYTTAQGGTISIATDGTYTYTPALNFTGTDSVDYAITDGSLTDTATLTITVSPVNDAPVAVDDAISIAEDTVFTSTVSLLANDSDVDSSFTAVAGTYTTAQGGTIVIAADGQYVYTPKANFNGTDTVDYTITDGSLTDTGTLTIVVTPVNDAPVANPDTATVVEDTIFTSTVSLLANDSDVDSSFTAVSGTYTTAQGGTISIATDGSYVYTPALNFTGTDSVDYTITDGSLTDTTTLTITVSPVNDAPVLSFTNTLTNIAENSAMAGMVVTDANATDAEGEMLTYSLNNMDGYYSIDPATGIVTLTQAGADWVNAGNDLPAVSVTVTDGTTPVTGTAAMPLTSLVNDAPVAMNDAISIVEDTIFTSTVSLLANDSDEESAITVIAGTYTTAQGGTISIATDGSYTYTPALNFTGTDSVDYTITDGSLTDTATLTITVSPVNDAPVAVDDAISIAEDTVFTSTVSLLANDSDVDSSFTAVAGTYTTAQGGTIVIAADGQYVYTPKANFNGTDTVDYTITDGSLTDTGTLTIVVTPVNDAPVAMNDAISIVEDTIFTSTVSLLANDSDVDSSFTAVSGTYTTAQGGTISIATDGSYVYTPAANFTGIDTVDYTITDGSLTDTATLTITVSSVNDAPVLSFTNTLTNIAENSAMAGMVVTDANATDAEGEMLTYSLNNIDGYYSIDPATGIVTLTQAGADWVNAGNNLPAVSVTVTDGTTPVTGTAAMPLTSLVNDAPVAMNDAISIVEDTIFTSTVSLLANDSDEESAITVIAGTYMTAQGGTISIATDGTYTYTPALNFTGTDSVDYTITDGSLTDTATLTITVSPVNDAPVAVDDAISIAEDTVFTSTVSLLANDSDVDSSFTAVAGTYTTAQGGTIVIAADGQYVYTPKANFNGTDTVDYTITDGSLTDTGTLTIVVTPVNDAPVAMNDAISIVEDTIFTSTVSLLANDSDVDSSFTAVSGTYTTAQGGTISIATDGSYVYTPAANFTGIDTVDYTITDGSLTDTATLTITVSSVNDAPVLSFTNTLTNIAENSAMAGMVVTDANATDAEGEMLTYSLNNIDGYYSIDPATGIVTLTQAGADWVNAGNNLPAVSVTVTDGTTPVTGTAAMPLTSLVNDAPVAMNDAISIVEDTIFTSTVSLLANDSDEESAITVIAGTYTTAQGGTISIATDGTYTYTPALNFTGTDSVDYTITDGSLTDTATLTITVSPVNDAPVAVDDAISIAEDTVFTSTVSLLANDSDVDSSFTAVAGTYTTAQGGTIVIAADGQYVYTPKANFNGTDTVDYTITDGSLTDTGTLTIVVTPVNDAPVAMNDAISIVEDTIFTSTVSLLANDSDVDSSFTAVSGTYTTAQGGTISIATDGSYVYTPAANFTGIDTVDYTITDGSLTDTATLTITVSSVNDAPVLSFTNTLTNIAENSAMAGMVVTDANATDAEGEMLTYSLNNMDGYYSIDPATGIVTLTQAGADWVNAGNNLPAVSVTVTDGTTPVTGTAAMPLTSLVNDAPVAMNDAISIVEDTIFTSTVSLLANDSDEESAITVIAGTYTTAQGGTISIATDGSYTYTPALNFTGTDSVDYTITDGSLTDTATLTITVSPVNDAPVAVDDAISIAEDTVFTSTVSLLANDSDVDSSFTAVAGTYTTAQGGTIVIAADGQYVYTPKANFNGTDTVDYTITDGSLTDTGTLTIVVTPVNDAPVANPDTATVVEDTLTTINVLGNDTDAEMDTLTVTAATALHGTVTTNPDGTLSYTPNTNYTGADTISYSITDGNGGTSSSVVNVTVTPVNDAPVLSFTNTLTNIAENSAMAGMVVTDANATDAEGEMLTYSLNNMDGYYSIDPATGIVTLTQAGADWVNAGNDLPAVSVTVTDGTTPVTGTAAMPLTSLVNDAPVAMNDAISIVEDTIFTSTVSLLANDSDEESAITVIAGTYTTAQGGTISIATDGSYTYTPALNFTGTDSVDYTITDGSLTDTATLTITVSPVNDAPVAVDDAISIAEDTVFTSPVSLLASDSDVEDRKSVV